MIKATSLVLRLLAIQLVLTTVGLASSTDSLALIQNPVTNRPLIPRYSKAHQNYLKLSWATYLRAQRQFPKARKLYLKVAESYPESAFLHTQIANTSLAIQDIKTAEKSAFRAIELIQKDETKEKPEPYFLLGQILLKQRSRSGAEQNWQRAITAFQKVTKIDPDHVNAHRYIGELSLLKEDYLLAIEAFKSLTRIMPYQPQFYMRLGQAYQKSDQKLDAIEAMERAVKIDPLLSDAHELLGELYIDYYDELETAVYGSAELELNLISKAQSALQKAISAYSQVRELRQKQMKAEKLAEYDQGIMTFRSRLGSLYLTADQPKLAIETLKPILETDPNHSDTNYLLGLAYQKVGKFDQSEYHLRLVVQTTKRSAAYNALGYLLAEQNKNLTEAVELIMFALEQDPENGAYLDSLGWAYYKQGQIKRAIKQLERAVKYEPNSWEIQDHLGDAYLKSGKVKKALEFWERAIELAPNNQVIHNKLQKNAGEKKKR